MLHSPELRTRESSRQKRLEGTINSVVAEMGNAASSELNGLRGEARALPSLEVLQSIIEGLQVVLFPEVYAPGRSKSSLSRQLLLNASQLGLELRHALQPGAEDVKDEELEAEISRILEQFSRSLPGLRGLLLSDAAASHAKDPASTSLLEVLISTPGFRAILHHRIAHSLYLLQVPMIPRMISYLALRESGIDIHPAAEIKEGFFIDHGTGVVIGETAQIGRNVRIYQGVTLGARSIPLDESGRAVRGRQRHPQLGNDVTIYSGTSILGPVSIGDGSVIGGNVWLTSSLPANSRVQQHDPLRKDFSEGAGI